MSARLVIVKVAGDNVIIFPRGAKMAPPSSSYWSVRRSAEVADNAGSSAAKYFSCSVLRESGWQTIPDRGGRGLAPCQTFISNWCVRRPIRQWRRPLSPVIWRCQKHRIGTLEDVAQHNWPSLNVFGVATYRQLPIILDFLMGGNPIWQRTILFYPRVGRVHFPGVFQKSRSSTIQWIHKGSCVVTRGR